MNGAYRIPRGLLSWLLFGLVACGGTLNDAQAASLRRQLRDAMNEPVGTRAERDDQSRLLADIVGKGAVDGLNHADVRAAFGPGLACRTDLCAKQGFGEDDWYYEIGQATSEEVKQLPVLMVGFDRRGRAARVWTLTTH